MFTQRSLEHEWFLSLKELAHIRSKRTGWIYGLTGAIVKQVRYDEKNIFEQGLHNSFFINFLFAFPTFYWFYPVFIIQLPTPPPHFLIFSHYGFLDRTVLERLTANAEVANVLGSIPASS